MDNPDKLDQPQDRRPKDLLELCWAMAENNASEGDVVELNELLLSDPENRRFYVLFMQVVASLEHEFVEPRDNFDAAGNPHGLESVSRSAPIDLSPIKNGSLSGDATELFPPQSPPSFWQTAKTLFTARFPVAMCASAATLFVLLAFWGFDAPWRATHVGAPQAASVAMTPVAYLVSANGCAWRNGSLHADAIDRSIQSGDEIILQEGIAEFRLSSGILLSIEGPAALVLTSPSSLMLQYGKLTARVPWEVKDFRLLAGTCRLSASEAEFGVNVTEHGVEVHSFSGDVTVNPSPFAGDSILADSPDPNYGFDDHLEFEPKVVSGGRSLSFVGEGSNSDAPQWGGADRGKFATKLSMGGRLPVSQDYVDAVLESRPVGYWRFESIRNSAVANEIEGGLPLVAMGEVSLSGDASNRVAELGRPQTSGHFETDGALPAMSGTTSYSVEMWIKPSHFHRGVLLGMIVKNDDPRIEQPDKHGFLLELQRGYESRVHPPGSLRFLHRNPPGIKYGISCYSNRLYGLRRWQHVVAVKQKSAMRIYIDGKVVGTADDKTPLAKGLRLVVGQTFSDQSVFPYIGQLDELAVYNRALIDSEIQKHCNEIQLDRQEESDR